MLGRRSRFTIIVYQGYSSSNSAKNGMGGFAYLGNCILRIGAHNISSNKASNGSGIYGYLATIDIFSTIELANNTAEENGGGLYMFKSSIINKIQAEFCLVFDHNTAHSKGGAIFIQDNADVDITCQSQTPHAFKDISMLFKNNGAPRGHVLYGGLLDRRKGIVDGILTSGIEQFKNLSRYEPLPLAITSDPVRVCLCTKDIKLDCFTRELSYYKKRGQSFDMLGAVVDQDMNPTESFITARYSEYGAKLGEGEGRTETGNNCTKLSHTIITGNTTSATLVLHPDYYCERSEFSSITIHITILPCPRGFETCDGRCNCDSRLTDYFEDPVCDIDTETVERGGYIWLRYDTEYLKVHSHCPLDYCNMSTPISVLHPDEQCANHRSGVLCGACQDNYSIALGGSQCLQCTSSYAIAWLIPVFAVAGVTLVALLLVCNMTISHGTLNGLIFYANVVSIMGLTGLRNCSIHPILSVFMAWINMDFGVETCLYSGMDTYQKTWLQFSFPLYIWLLVGAIIMASHYSSTAMKMFGRNNIAILATLFLLSYTKILKTIITALSFTQVFQGSASDTSDQLMPYNVWTHDGNIEYLKGKHVPLFIVSLALLVFLFIPYTMLLMLGQCIRSMPARRRCVLWWTHSTAFISIMDAYHAPYKRKHRYWTGLMLLARCVLFLAFASSHSDNELLTNVYITTLEY